MDEHALRLLALEIAHMLPENSKDAMRVLELAKGLAQDFLCKSADIVAFVPQSMAGS